MAEIKNSFLRSKMNKDLDDRLIPNGEYRDAQNISVGKSEADDLGALETVLGNAVATNFGLSNNLIQVIGYCTIEERNSIVVFLTDYTDSYAGGDPTLAPSSANCYIYEYINGSPSKIVEGNFLNFSTTDEITGVSVIESLLFWTDNRNQPRKINLNFGISGTYYTEENHISVAKYNPYLPISLLDKVETTTTGNAASPFNFTDTVTQAVTGAVEFRGDLNSLPPLNAWNEFGAGVIKVTKTSDGSTIADSGADAILSNYTVTVYGPGTWNTYTFPINVTTTNALELTFTCPAVLNKLVVADATGIKKGMYIVGAGILATDYIYVTDITGTTITLSDEIVVTSGDITFLSTTMTGEDITYNFNDGDPASWPGDPDYLESKFIRLSYRFEFDDGEYSLMAPFTQICFIPKQKGYFIYGDEESAYRSTVVEFMENGVQNIELLIPFPDILNNVQPSASASYKIKALDILYKEADSTVVKVIDTIQYNEPNESGATWVATTDTNIYTYNYQSRKPFRTLLPAQTTRVYDKVPVKALAQETAGNRIIYGNFLDKYTPPATLNYIVGVGPKSQSLNYDNWCEYPNHSVKQNRNYQVGFILADKFGRQSDVILSLQRSSSVTAGDGTIYGGDTIYSPYNINNTSPDIINWFGDALKINIDETIGSSLSINAGTPGLYAITRGDGFNIAGVAPTINNTNFTYSFILNVAAPSVIPIIGSYLTGEYTDYVKVTNIIQSTTAQTPGVTQPSSTTLNIATANTNIVPGMIVTAVPTGGWSVQAGTTVVSINGTTIILNQVPHAVLDTPANYTITFTMPTNGYVVTCDGAISITSYSLTDPAITPDSKMSYTINPIGWYSYKVVVKQQEQDYYNVYLPGILKGYPAQDNTITGYIPLNPNTIDPIGTISNIVLINDNINKIPRDLAIVGPDQKQFRSSVQLFGRVENDTATTNIQYFPGILSDTAISISTADDTNILFDVLTASTIPPAASGGQDNLYQIDTNPLIARIDTTTSIGSVTNAMRPYLAIYETEPKDSLLDIFWETPTVGLISDLNQTINAEYEGVVGFEAYSSSGLTEGITGDFITGLSPVDVGGSDVIKTGAANYVDTPTIIVEDNNGLDVTSYFTITRTGTGVLVDPNLYNFGIINTVAAANFVYNNNEDPRIYTISLNITNHDPALSSPITSAVLELNVELQNVQPIINGGIALPNIIGIQEAYTGTLVDINGVNGALVPALNQEELNWSIIGGNPNNYFDIDQNGVVSKIVGSTDGSTLGTHVLTIQLQDAYNGGAAIGSKTQTTTQSITVVSTVIGTPFTASPSGVINQSCAADGSLNPLCGTATFYNQTSVSPTVNDEIRTGPSGSASPLAAAGYYSYDCGYTGAGNRKYFKILASSLGIIDTVSTC